MDNAQKARQQARRKLGMPVYIAEIGGMFKLRAGDFSSRSEANKAKEKAEQMGYKGAFPVRSRIR
jgi:cell division septation protein DedD